jgi:hypothetical protein
MPKLLWPLMSEVVGRANVNEKMPNKIHTRESKVNEKSPNKMRVCEAPIKPA